MSGGDSSEAATSVRRRLTRWNRLAKVGGCAAGLELDPSATPPLLRRVAENGSQGQDQDWLGVVTVFSSQISSNQQSTGEDKARRHVNVTTTPLTGEER